jgi:hypothetical protein
MHTGYSVYYQRKRQGLVFREQRASWRPTAPPYGGTTNLFSDVRTSNLAGLSCVLIVSDVRTSNLAGRSCVLIVFPRQGM